MAGAIRIHGVSCLLDGDGTIKVITYDALHEQLLFAGLASQRASAAQSFLEYNVNHWKGLPDSCRREIKADR